MEHNNLITIGDLSRLTNVHIKSLRYYDRIGILKPAYVNPETGYRYYSFLQMSLVEAIRICVELDIPLKKFSQFVSDNTGEIYYTSLLEYGKKIADEKIRKIQDGLEFIKESQEEIRRTAYYQDTRNPVVFALPKKKYWLSAYEGSLNWGEYLELQKELFTVIRKEGGQNGYDFGKLSVYREDHVEKYIFSEVLNCDHVPNAQICSIPAGQYLCVSKEKSSIDLSPKLFPEQFCSRGEGKEILVIEAEMFTGEYNYIHPVYELRCKLENDV